MLNVSLDQLEIYLYVKTQHDRHSWANYRGRFLKIKEHFAKKPFTTQGIGEYLLSIENLSTSTRCAYFDMMEYICRILGVDYINAFKRPKVVNRKKFVLTSEEMIKLLSVSYRLSYRMSVAIELSIRQGLRFSEIRNLKWTDLIDNELTLRDPKSSKPETVYIPNDLIDKIKKLNTGREYIFANTNGLLSNHGANAYLKNILKMCGIARVMTWHDLRHTTASDLADKDINLKVIQEFMRHKHITTTERYIHLKPTKLLEAAKKHTLAIKNWTKEEINKEAKKFMDTISETNFKSSIVYGEEGVEIKISY